MPLLEKILPSFVVFRWKRPAAQPGAGQPKGVNPLSVMGQVLAQAPADPLAKARVLVCKKKKGAAGYSVGTSQHTGLIGRLLERQDRARFDKKLRQEMEWCEQQFEHWPEVGAALEVIRPHGDLGSDRFRNTKELHGALRVLVVARDRAAAVQGSVEAMRAYRNELKQHTPGELRARLREQDGHSKARSIDRDNARLCNRIWAEAVPDIQAGVRRKATQARTTELRRFVDEQSQRLGQTPLQFLQQFLLVSTASFDLRPRVFTALVKYFVELGVQQPLALPFGDQQAGDLDQLLQWLAPVLPTGLPLAPAMTQNAERELAPMSAGGFATMLSANLNQLTAALANVEREPGEGLSEEEAQLQHSIGQVEACQVDGVFLDTPEFRSALSHLVRARNALHHFQEKEAPLMRLGQQLETAYLDHRTQVRAMDAVDLQRQWGIDGMRRHGEIAARLNEVFKPSGPPEGPFDVDADQVEYFFSNDPSQIPHEVLHHWLTDTAVPRYLNDSVFQALARYCMSAKLLEASDAQG